MTRYELESHRGSPAVKTNFIRELIKIDSDMNKLPLLPEPYDPIVHRLISFQVWIRNYSFNSSWTTTEVQLLTEWLLYGCEAPVSSSNE